MFRGCGSVQPTLELCLDLEQGAVASFVLISTLP